MLCVWSFLLMIKEIVCFARQELVGLRRFFRAIRVQEKNFASLRLCVEDINVFAPPLQIPTKVGASPISRLFYETDFHRVWYGFEAEEKRRINGLEVNEKFKVKNGK